MLTIPFSSGESVTILLNPCLPVTTLSPFSEGDNKIDYSKHTISDVLYGSDQCLASFTPFTWAALTLSVIFLVLRTLRAAHHFIQYYDIKLFYNTALKIQDVSYQEISVHQFSL